MESKVDKDEKLNITVNEQLRQEEKEAKEQRWTEDQDMFMIFSNNKTNLHKNFY